MREFFRKCQLILLLAMGSLPLVLYLLGYAAPELSPYAWAFPVAYTVLTAVGLLIKGKWRILWGLASVLVFVVPCAVFFSGYTRYVMTIAACGYSILLLASIQIAGWDADRELSGPVIILCAFTQLIGQPAAVFFPVLEPYTGWLNALFFVSAILAMLSMNRGSLRMAFGQGRNISRLMRNKNLLLTFGLFAIGLLCALVPSLIAVVRIVVGWCIVLTEKLKSLFSDNDQQATIATEATTAEETQLDLGLDLSTQETSPVVYAILLILALAIGVPTAVYALCKLAKTTWRILRSLLTAFLHSTTAEGADYEDEITDTREDTGLQRKKKRRTKRLKAADERNLTPGQRVRYRYAQLLEKNPQWRPGSTARENLSSGPAAIYERARYSPHPVSAEEAQQFKTETK